MGNIADDNNERLAPISAPDYDTIVAVDFLSKDAKTALTSNVKAAVQEVSRDIDLSTLDGVTIAADHARAVAGVDRGAEGLRQIGVSTAEIDGAIGVAKSIAVLRDGQVRTHIVFNVKVLAGLISPDPADLSFRQALQTVAHECGHVEVTAVMERSFPGEAMGRPITSEYDFHRWNTTSAAWEEYCVTRLTACYGENPTPNYQSLVIDYLTRAHDEAQDAITRYRTHGDIRVVVEETLRPYGNLIKYSGYLLGTLDGLGVDPGALPELTDVLRGHWFEGNFASLHQEFRNGWSKWGKWDDLAAFAGIGDVLIAALRHGGFFMTPTDDGNVAIEIPFRPENTPYHPIVAPFGLR